MKIRKLQILITILFLLIGVPIILNLLYFPHQISYSVWSPGDFLSYFGTISMGATTVYLGYKANKMNERLMEYEIISRKSYVSISVEDCYLNIGENSTLFIIKFKRLTDVPIVGAVAHKSKIIGSDGVWSEENTCDSEIFSIGDVSTMDIDNDGVTLTLCPKESMEKHIFSVILELTSIYGYKTEQYVNICIINRSIYNASTIEKK